MYNCHKYAQYVKRCRLLTNEHLVTEITDKGRNLYAVRKPYSQSESNDVSNMRSAVRYFHALMLILMLFCVG